MDFREAVALAKEGESVGQEFLYQETLKHAYFVACKVIRQEDDRMDLIHDAYLTAFAHLDQLEDPNKFQPWLNMIVANKCRDHLKKKKPALFTDIQPDDGPELDWEDDREENAPELVVDRAETVRLVQKIIESLPEDQKLCVILYYQEELSIAQIAEALQVSEGTVKSRLNYARKKIKAQVEQLEKEGTKLYGMAPLPLLAWLLRAEAEAATVPAQMLLPPAGAAGAAVGSSTGAASGSTAAVGTAAAATGGTTGGLLSGVTAKVVLGLAITGAVVGGTVAVGHTVKGQQETPIEHPAPIVVEQNEEDLAVANAEAATLVYEELMARGVTDSGVAINYYAYLDLDHDDIPELLVADDAGTEECWSTGELYTFRNQEMQLCGQTNSRYDFFYLVNDQYLAGMHRMGVQYISTEQFFATTIYHWNKEGTRNDPAIRHSDGTWEYITKEEFKKYNPHPFVGSGDAGTSFVETAEPIELQANTYKRPNKIRDILDISKVWTMSKSVDDYEYCVAYMFEESGVVYVAVGNDCHDMGSLRMDFYKGIYYTEGDTLVICVDKDGVPFECIFSMEIKEEQTYMELIPGEGFREVKGDQLYLTQLSEEGWQSINYQGESDWLKEDQPGLFGPPEKFKEICKKYTEYKNNQEGN